MKQRGLKQIQFVEVLTLVEGVRLRSASHAFFGESRKIVPRIHGTILPRDEGKNLVTMHHQQCIERTQKSVTRTFSPARRTLYIRWAIWSPTESMSVTVQT